MNYEHEDDPEPRTCLRCKTPDQVGPRCNYCGVHLDRPVRYCRRRNIGGKRGRNSGKVSNHGKGGG